jgi:hypothetical protein
MYLVFRLACLFPLLVAFVSWPQLPYVQTEIEKRDSRKYGQPGSTTKISARVYYEDQMLIICAEKDVIAVVFSPKANKIEYRYRARAAGSTKESRGAGVLFVKRKEVPPPKNLDLKAIDPKKKRFFEDDGSKLYIEMGKHEMYWSPANSESGWIYYEPEKVRVHLAGLHDFEVIDLGRFQEK